MDDHPLTLASVATIEILVKWTRWGIPIAELEYDNGQTMADMLAEGLDTLQRAVERTPTISHGYDLLADLALMRRTPLDSFVQCQRVSNRHGKVSFEFLSRNETSSYRHVRDAMLLFIVVRNIKRSIGRHTNHSASLFGALARLPTLRN